MGFPQDRVVVGLLYGAVQGVDRLLHYYVFHPEMLQWEQERLPDSIYLNPVMIFLKQFLGWPISCLFFVFPVSVVLLLWLRLFFVDTWQPKEVLRIAVYCLPCLFLSIGATIGLKATHVMQVLILIGGIRALAPAARKWAPLMAISAFVAHYAWWVIWAYLNLGLGPAYEVLRSIVSVFCYPLPLPDF